MSLGKRLKNLREEQELTQDKLAEMANVDRSTIQMLENRDSKQSKFAPALAKALGVTLEYLLSGSDSPSHRTQKLTEEEQELLTLWRHIEPSEREPLLRELRGKVEGYKRAAAHLAKMGVKLDAPQEHDFPFKIPTKK